MKQKDLVRKNLTNIHFHKKRNRERERDTYINKSS